jgi:hypothetical protein
VERVACIFRHRLKMSKRAGAASAVLKENSTMNRAIAALKRVAADPRGR